MKNAATNKHNFLKEILSERELELFLKLRYHCFSGSGASLFVRQNSKEIDINYYDRNSLHYGVYVRGQQHEQAVGYFRIVLVKPTIADVWVKSIANKFRLNAIANRKPESILPCLGIYPGNGLEQEFFVHIKSIESTGEISRLFIVETERSLKLALQMVRGAFAIALLHLRQAFVGCFQHHAKAFMKFGFKQYPGTSAFAVGPASKQQQGLILYCKTDYIHFDLKKPIQRMQEQFLAENYLNL